MPAERLRGVAAVALGSLLLAACAPSDVSPGAGSAPAAPADGGPAVGTPAAPPTELPSTYVALGDSFTSAPFVPVTDLADGCFRSSNNYPRLVAEEIGAALVDVSCGGARTDDLVERQSFAFTDNTMPPQLRAVTPAAELVTVGIGGNDSDLFNTLVHECTRVADRPGTSCQDLVTNRQGAVDRVVSHIGQRVARSLRKVQRRAPAATVVLVGYPRLVDDTGRCPQMPLTPPDRRFVARVESSLRDAMAAAARRTDVEFVDMHEASRGHEICSDDPWVNGIRTDQERALAFHPFAAGQRAVAEHVVDVLR